MKIDISTKEYEHLLDILHIADVIMSGHRKEEDRRSEPHRAIIQKLYAIAPHEGLERFIGYNSSLNKYLPTQDFERSTLAHTVIDEFREHLFWDELIDRLSARDAAQIAGGIDHLNAMNDIDRQHVESSIRQRYMEEFAMNGVANVAVLERFRSGEETPSKTSD